MSEEFLTAAAYVGGPVFCEDSLGFTDRTLHIGPARGHIANPMALKNRGIWLKISALAYIL